MTKKFMREADMFLNEGQRCLAANRLTFEQLVNIYLPVSPNHWVAHVLVANNSRLIHI